MDFSSLKEQQRKKNMTRAYAREGKISKFSIEMLQWLHQKIHRRTRNCRSRAAQNRTKLDWEKKWFLMISYYIHRSWCLAQLSSDRQHPATNESSFRNPQSNTRWGMEAPKREVKDCRSQKGWRQQENTVHRIN